MSPHSMDNIVTEKDHTLRCESTPSLCKGDLCRCTSVRACQGHEGIYKRCRKGSSIVLSRSKARSRWHGGGADVIPADVTTPLHASLAVTGTKRVTSKAPYRQRSPHRRPRPRPQLDYFGLMAGLRNAGAYSGSVGPTTLR